MSGLRRVGDDFDPVVVAAIDARLRSVTEREHAGVLLAVESGSRAWGFPSPDSDYDCRFIYARRRDDYLALFPPRDVIEFPADPVLDVNGWDLAKTLRLMLKGNAVVIEWLTSPFVYAGDAGFREEALALARQAAVPAAIARHYLHLGERQRRTYFADAQAIPLGDARARRWVVAAADRRADRCRVRDRTRALGAPAVARGPRDGGGRQRAVSALGRLAAVILTRQSIFRKKPAPDLIRVETGFPSENAINART
jgi:hypothetical protein